MSGFDRLRRKAEDAERAEQEKQRKWAADSKKMQKEYARYERLAVGVLKRMYKLLYKPQKPSWAPDDHVRYEPRISAYAIYPLEGMNLDHGYMASVTVRLAFDDNLRATHFMCEVGGNTGNTTSLDKVELEELLARLYELPLPPRSELRDAW